MRRFASFLCSGADGSWFAAPDLSHLKGLIAAVLGAGLLITGASGANLLQNGDFQVYDALFHLEHWQLMANGNPAATSPAIKGSPAGDIVVLLDQDPSGGGFASAQVMLLQPIVLPPNSPRLLFSAQVARDINNPGPGGAVEFALQANTLGGAVMVPLDLDADVISADGNFHSIQGRGILPPDYLPGDAQFLVVKGGAGFYWVDGLSLEAVTPQFNVQPGRGPSEGGIPVQLMGPQLGPGANVFFDNAPAPVQNAQPGLLTVMLPPHVPGAVDVRVTLMGGIQQTQRAGFFYLEPLMIGAVAPQTGPTTGGTPVRLTGSGFLPPVQVAFNGSPSTAQPTVVSSQELLLVIPPLAGGAHTIQVTDAYGRMTVAPQPLMISAPPQVSTVTPSEGPSEGGTAITVTGSGFLPGATIRLGPDNATGVQVLSPTEIQAVTPPNLAGLYDVVVSNAEGVSGVLPEAFTYGVDLPGDVNGDQRVDLEDVVLALQVSAGQDPSVALNLGSDANGDGQIGLEEAARALEITEQYPTNSFAVLPAPSLSVVQTELTEGTPVAALVNELGYFSPGTIHWGDGFTTQLNEDGAYSHLYDAPGEFTVKLQSGHGPGPSVNVTVAEVERLRIVSSSLGLSGNDINGQPIAGQVALIDPEMPPAVTLQLVLEGTGLAQGVLRLDAPTANDTFIPVMVEFTNTAPGLHTNSSVFGNFTFPEAGIYHVTFNVDSSTEATIDGAHPTPVTVMVPSSVLETNCTEIQREWEDLAAEKAAKKKECDELAQKISDLQAQRADLQAQQDAAQEQRDALQEELEAVQDDFDMLFDYINAFLDGAGSLVQYGGAGDFPAGANHIGVRNNGASAGVGISFSSAPALLNQMQLYAEANGRSMGADLATLRKQIAQMDGLNNQIAQAEADIENLQNQMDAIDQQLMDLQSQLEDCMNECDALEADVADLAAEHAECLEELEKARKAEQAIADAEQAGEQAQEKSDETADAANEADETIGGRSGSPGQKQSDHEDVEEGRDCQEMAQDLIDQGKQKLEDAKNAATPEEAEQLAGEAKALFEQADDKLDQANESINQGESRAQTRKPIECTEGSIIVGPSKVFPVWTEIIDVAIIPMGYTPEEWASAWANIDRLLTGFKIIFFIIEEAEEFSPISLTFTPDADEAAEAIINAHIELLKNRVGCNLWLRLGGHTRIERVDRVCVNGCWTTEQMVIDLNDMLQMDQNIGEILGTTPEERQAQAKTLINKWLNSGRGTKSP